MVKKNYFKLILSIVILFSTAIIAAISMNAAVPDVDFNQTAELRWFEISAEEEYFSLGVDDIYGTQSTIPAIADYTNPTDMRYFVTYNGVNAIYENHTEAYLYWVFDGVNEVVDFYNFKFHLKETVDYIDLVDVISYDIEIPIIQHSITFYNEDVVHDVKTVLTNRTVELPEVPLKDGHHFVDWYYDKAYHYEFDSETLIKHDLTLYAKFQADEINVNFYNGLNLIKTEIIEYGEEMNIVYLPKLLNYYNKDLSFRPKEFSIDQPLGILTTGDMEWKINKGGLSIDENKLIFEGITDISSMTPFSSLSFLTFRGDGSNGLLDFSVFYSYNNIDWIKFSYTHEYDGARIYISDSINVVEPVFLKIQHTTERSLPDYILMNESFCINTYSPYDLLNSYEFENWYYDEELTQPYNENDVFLEDTNLYAGYKEVENNIEFKIGDEVYHSFISNNFKIDLPVDPLKVGYTFDGWYYDEEFLNAFDIEADITEDLTLYAKFTLNKHTIRFYFENEEYATAVYDIQNGVILPEVPEIALEDEFLGWYYDELFENKFATTDIITENINLYGKIETINFNIDFRVDNELYDSFIYIKDSEFILPATPIKEELIFLGWYYDEEFENKFSLEDEILEDIILYGRFSSGSGGGLIDDSDETKFKTEYIGYAALGLVAIVVVIGLVKAPKKRKKR